MLKLISFVKPKPCQHCGKYAPAIFFFPDEATPTEAAPACCEEARRDHAWRKHDEEVKKVIDKHLESLHADLGHFTMTCHAALRGSGIRGVAESLVDVAKDPTAYNISNLYQRIGYYLKERPGK